MITVIRDIDVYEPKHLGKKQVVIVGDKFEGIYDEINIPEDFVNINIINGKGKIMMPGFIDNHVHLLGGGGEGGFATRTPEVKFTELTKAGITTVVGCLGTDNVCRGMAELIAKTRVLTEEGISAYCYTGSYEIPVKTLTKSIKEDLMIIDKVIGVGEIAISDHRSSEPSAKELLRGLSEARVGGLLSGKGGIVDIHVGSGKKKIDMLFSIIEDSEIPATQILPTHMNRSTELFNDGIEYIKKGGYIDLTTSSNPDYMEPGEIRASEGLAKLYKKNIPIEHVTFSSDGNGSLPLYDKNNKLVGIDICSVKSLYGEVRNAVLNYNVPLEIAIKVITSNASDILKLSDVGRIKSKFNADFVMADMKSLEITDVFARGRFLIKDNKILVKGKFE
ncbi:MAG: beta-aspartyl-peptidase [Clostridium sp.]|nr:beta-aspartyl-peptidase [Clostridium sp.]